MPAAGGPLSYEVFVCAIRTDGVARRSLGRYAPEAATRIVDRLASRGLSCLAVPCDSPAPAPLDGLAEEEPLPWKL